MTGSGRSTAFARGAAATAFPDATAAAIEILDAGGNAVDAAVAAGWALSVCEPAGSGLGGQTVALIRLADGTVRVIDGHSRAPQAASARTITKRQQRQRHRACTVPSTPATLAYLQAKYGKLQPARAMEPAIRIAEEGFTITPLQHRQTGWVAEHLRDCEAASSLYLEKGCPPRPGTLFRQPVLAATLRRLALAGAEDFYQGGVARLIVRDMERCGGLLTETDLGRLDAPVEREPLSVDYRGFRVVTVPPPGGGLQLLLALRIMAELATETPEADLDRWYTAAALAIWTAFRERQTHPLAPDAADPQTLATLLSDRRARDLAMGVRERPPRQHFALPPDEPGDTTHLSVADRDGNIVSLTQSIQSLFGAKVANPEAGFLYNNYLRTCPRRPHPHGLGSGCLPRSNASPTLVLDGGGQPVLALGAAGSRRIVSSALQVIAGVMDLGRSLPEAVAAPRVHALLSGRAWLERPAASASLTMALSRQFSEVELRRRNDYGMGAVQALGFSPAGEIVAVADPRRDGTALYASD